MTRALILFLFLPLFSFAQSWQWTKKEAATYPHTSHSICTDGMGNCYAAVDSASHANILKYNSIGNLIWKVNIWQGAAQAIATDNLGHLYVAGDSLAKYDTSGTLIWKIKVGPGCSGLTLDNNLGFIYLTGTFTFLQKFDTSGNLLWARNSNIYVTGNSVCTDNLGYCYITGSFYDTASFGINLLTALGRADIFITKYDPSGNCLWAKRAGGKNATVNHIDCGNAVIADNLGNIYFTGAFVDTADFDSFTLIVSGPNTYSTEDIFLAKYDVNGNALWVRHATGGSDEEAHCITIDDQNNILIGGCYVPTINFSGIPLTGWGNYDAFVAKYDSNGNFIDAIGAGGSFWNDCVYGICTDNSGNTFVTGNFFSNNTNTYFGSDTLIGTGVYVFVSKIDLNVTTAIKEIKNNSFKINIYPNPATDQITIEFNASKQNALIEVRNVLGEILYSEKLKSNTLSQSINVSEFSNGVYFVTLQSDKQKVVAKFIKN